MASARPASIRALVAVSFVLAGLPAGSATAAPGLAAGQASPSNSPTSSSPSSPSSPSIAPPPSAPTTPALRDCGRQPAPALDWSTAQQRLLGCNRDVVLAWRSVELARADIQIAGQRPNPTLSVGGESISPSAGIGAGGPLDKQIDYTARLDQTFERGGKRQYRVEAADQAWRAATWTAADTVRQTELDLARNWIDLWGAQEKLGLHQELSGLYQRTLDGARRRLKAGDISSADLARIELEAQHAAAERAAAEGERIEARNVVAALLAMESSARSLTAVDPWPLGNDVTDGSAPGRDAGDPGSGGEGAAIATLRPDLLAARAEAAAAAARGALARSLQTRDVTIGVQSERYARPAGNGWSFGLFASVPLFVHHASEGEIARAEAERDRAELGATSLERQALADHQRLLDAREAARLRRERLERDALPLAQRVANDADLGFRKGAGTVLDLLDGLRQLRTLQLDALAARLDEDRADAELRAGMLLPGSARDPVFGAALDRRPGR